MILSRSIGALCFGSAHFSLYRDVAMPFVVSTLSFYVEKTSVHSHSNGESRMTCKSRVSR